MVADRGRERERERETVIVNGKWCNEIREEKEKKKNYKNSRTHWRDMWLRHRHTNTYTHTRRHTHTFIVVWLCQILKQLILTFRISYTYGAIERVSEKKG